MGSISLATGDPVTESIAGSNTGYGILTASWKVAITRKKKGEKSKIGIGKEVIKRAATRTREKMGKDDDVVEAIMRSFLTISANL